RLTPSMDDCSGRTDFIFFRSFAPKSARLMTNLGAIAGTASSRQAAARLPTSRRESRPTMRTSIILAGLFLGLSCSAPAVAQDVFAGTWVVTDAQPAPWVDATAGTQPDIDQTIRRGTFTFKNDSIEGPAPFDCKKVQYTISEVGPDYLFEGGLTDPVPQA